MRIACIGGGPGSEILGVVRYLKKRGLDKEGFSVEITIFDKESSWKTLCGAVLKEIDHKCEIALKFVEFDATEKSTYQNIEFSKFHVISCFFLSETRKLGIASKSKAFWRFLLGSMTVGSAILLLDYADNDGKNWDFADSLLSEFDRFESLAREQSVAMSCTDDKGCLLDLESELDHRPKKNGTNFLKVASVRRK